MKIRLVLIFFLTLQTTSFANGEVHIEYGKKSYRLIHLTEHAEGPANVIYERIKQQKTNDKPSAFVQFSPISRECAVNDSNCIISQEVSYSIRNWQDKFYHVALKVSPQNDRIKYDAFNQIVEIKGELACELFLLFKIDEMDHQEIFELKESGLEYFRSDFKWQHGFRIYVESGKHNKCFEGYRPTNGLRYSVNTNLFEVYRDTGCFDEDTCFSGSIQDIGFSNHCTEKVCAGVITLGSYIFQPFKTCFRNRFGGKAWDAKLAVERATCEDEQSSTQQTPRTDSEVENKSQSPADEY